MVKLAGDYSFLDSLIGGWFHQDFDVNGDTLEEILASYRKAQKPEELLGARADIEKFLREHDDSHLTEEFVRRFQPGVDPEAWGMSTREWLLRIDELLR